MRRERLADLKQYALPRSLDALEGPSSGRIELPHDVFWAPGGGELSLDSDDTLAQAYQALLSEGDEAQITHLVNKENIIRIWPNLNLPIRVARDWEMRFPELEGNMRASW